MTEFFAHRTSQKIRIEKKVFSKRKKKVMKFKTKKVSLTHSLTLASCKSYNYVMVG